MKFEIVVIHTINDRTAIGGRDIQPELINLKDLEKVIETEQLLERLLGKRVHINQVSQ